jgi:hypothetical protein
MIETARGASGSQQGAARPPLITQVIAQEPRTAPGAVMFVVDGSARAAPAFPALRAALARIPPSTVVGPIVADEGQSLRVDPAPLTAAHSARLAEALSRGRPRGGQDNAGALADAISALAQVDDAALVWIHAPQPVRFFRNSVLLEQTLERSTRLPGLILYPVLPGPNRILMDDRWFYEAASIPASGDVEADLAGLVHELYARTPQWRIRREPASAGVSRTTNRSGHIARLWAHDRVLSLAAASDAEARSEALRLAAAYRLVTPVSGAVVLETDADYTANNLAPPDASQIPTVPEPSTWAMLLIACACLAFMAWRNRRLFRMPRAVAQ